MQNIKIFFMGPVLFIVTFWANFLHTDCDAKFFGWIDIVLYIFNFNKCQSTAVVLVGPPAVAEMELWNRVCPSLCCAVCLEIFLGLIIRFFWILVWCLKALSCCVWQKQIFWEKLFLPKKFRKFAQNRPKIGFFEFKKRFGQ